MANSITIRGIPELLGELDRLDKKLSDRIERKALREGAEIIRSEAERRVSRADVANWPQYGGHIKDQIVKRVYKKDSMIAAVVGPAEQAFWGIFIEKGAPLANRNRFHKGGKSVGKMPAQPFLRPAFDENIDRVFNLMRDTVRAEIAKAGK